MVSIKQKQTQRLVKAVKTMLDSDKERFSFNRHVYLELNNGEGEQILDDLEKALKPFEDGTTE